MVLLSYKHGLVVKPDQAFHSDKLIVFEQNISFPLNCIVAYSNPTQQNCCSLVGQIQNVRNIEEGNPIDRQYIVIGPACIYPHLIV